jgi:hypothetical protein
MRRWSPIRRRKRKAVGSLVDGDGDGDGLGRSAREDHVNIICIIEDGVLERVDLQDSERTKANSSTLLIIQLVSPRMPASSTSKN